MDVNYFENGSFFVGMNYWASHAGTNMWKDWRQDVVECDLKQLSEMGVSVLRVFPLWPDFQPLKILQFYQGRIKEIAKNEEFLDETKEEDRAGVDVNCIKKFEILCDIAKRNDIKLIVPLINGYMSGRSFVPEAFIGRNVLTDALCIKWEKRFINYFVNHFKDNQSIIAWELGNESNCLGSVNTEEEAWLWTSSLVDAVKTVDKSRIVISGMHSLQCGGFTVYDQAENCDMLAVHPYMLFTKFCNLDPLVSPRAIGHISAEQTFYSDLGKKNCLVEEIGSLGSIMGDEKEIAKFVRAGLFNSWAHNGLGYLWWCAYDQTSLMFAPYDWHDIERELGMIREDRTEKYFAKSYKEFVDFLNRFPYKKLPQRRRNAVCLLNNCFAWDIAFGSFMIAKRAGIELQFADRDIPEDAKLYIIPGSQSNDVLQKRYMNKLLGIVEKGATLLITYNGSMMSPFEYITGCKSNGRYASNKGTVVFENETFTFAKRFEIDLVPDKAEVIAYDEIGRPAFVSNKFGEGKILFLNAPIEYQIVSTPNAPSSEFGYEKFYRYAASVAGIENIFSKTNPHLDITVHDLDDKNAIVVILNNTNTKITDKIRFNGKLNTVYYGKANTIGEEVEIEIDEADAVVLSIGK